VDVPETGKHRPDVLEDACGELKHEDDEVEGGVQLPKLGGHIDVALGGHEDQQ
jgi:hypothetical protein